MSLSPDSIKSLDQAVAYVLEMIARHPERNALLADEAILAGRPRKYPVIYLNHLASPEDHFEPEGELELPEVNMAPGPEADLARELVGLLNPLKLDNPVSPCLGLGRGTGTLVACFGVPLNPEADYSPAYYKTIAEVLADDPPDPETCGLMPEMHRKIDLIKQYLPSDFKIRLPDMQGPYNIAHALLGDEALMAPYIDPDGFHAVMERITTLWLQARDRLLTWIGPDYCYPGQGNKIAECSVNLVSTKMYLEHILPHDQHLAEEVGDLHVHPCSGPHVFHATLENLPVVYTEAGHIAKTAAGSTSVDEALEAIGDRDIALNIGQEPPEGEELEFILQDLQRYEQHKRLQFAYTGMHWRKKDRPLIRDIHRQLDDYWASAYGD